MKSKFNKLITALFCTFLAIIIVASCKKDYHSKDQPSKQELNKLAQWYENNLKVSENNPFSKLKPDWTKVYVKQQGPHKVYEISLANQEKLVVSTNEEKRMLEEVVQNTGMRLLIFEERASDKILYASYMNLQANVGQTLDHLHYRDVGNFSGTILYYHFSGNLSNGWNYLNGKITEKITAITEQQFNQAQKHSQSDKKTDAMVCTSGFVDKYQWQCVGVPGYLNCGFNYVGKEYITVCNWQEPEQTIDHIAPEENGGAYLPPIYIDCANVANGKATWSNECNTCIGGTTGIEACPPKIITEIKVDTNARDCVDSILKTILSRADDISLCVSDLMSIANVNSSAALTRLASLSNYKINISETFIRDVTAYDVNGNEISTRTNGITDDNGNIGLNQLMLNDATDLGVAATMIHELMHSYFVYGINHTSGNEQFFFSTMNTFLFDKNGVPNQNQANAQHTQMAATYVNSMASLLSKYAQSRGIITSPDSSISLLEYCKDIFWKNLSYSQAYTIAPNKNRAIANADREYKNQSNSSKKKGC